MARTKPAKADLNNQNALNAGHQKAVKGGGPASQQDPNRRLGVFVGAGEAARKGSRTSGVGGQTVQKNRTDKKQK